ncbi:hypothetical protein BSP239C_03918 [Brevibacterium sp. 239c]|uniref:hypothetical protein n=1 Tax=Brevibacterium sp. 239c TaxID=1965356 RepID=UPI000C50D7A3|nr:hypothetical protein [Brevibacterium sp. 239c]SMY04643.1 hypothetical protein BSP239C_03918 [Brevibacterium sp. 239c]
MLLNWDQQAQRTVDAVHLEPEFDVLGHSHSLSVLREHKREAFVDGARWQRGEFQGDESVERVRVFLHDTVGVNADSETARRLVNALLTGA